MRSRSVAGFVVAALLYALIGPRAASAQAGAVPTLAGTAVAPNVRVRAPSHPAAWTDLGVLPEMNHTYRGQIRFLDRDTPLPGGDWTVIARSRSTYRIGPPTGGLVLLRRKGNVLTGVLRIDGNKAPRETSASPVGGVCAASNVIWSDAATVNPGGPQDCVAITFYRTALWRDRRAPAVYHSITVGLDSYDITPPPVMLSVAFYAANARYSLFEELMLNPDLAGIPPDLSTYRSRSEWAAYNLDRDPRKRAYVNRLIAWSAKWRAVLKTLLSGEQIAVPADVSATP